jgi:hypothetical protein
MKKPLLIAIIILVVVLVVVALIFFRGNAPTGSTGTGAPTSTGGGLPTVSPGATPATAPTGATFVIGTPQGSVTVNNFYKSAAYVTQDRQTVVLEQTSTYSIVYNTSDSGFIISLLSTPLPAARTAAETAFLQNLGISQQGACKLTVQEGVPINVSDQYPGENLGLSFCPGAVNL